MAYRTFRYFDQSHGSYLGKFEIDLTKAECEGAARSIEWLPPDKAERLRGERNEYKKQRDEFKHGADAFREATQIACEWLQCGGRLNHLKLIPLGSSVITDGIPAMGKKIMELERDRDSYREERDRWKETARQENANRDYWKGRAEKAEAELAELRAKAKPGEVEMVMLRNIKPTETFRFKADGSDPICIVMGSGAYYTGYIQAGKPGVNWVDGSTMVRPVAKETS